jgi:hypothetical protein
MVFLSGVSVHPVRPVAPFAFETNAGSVQRDVLDKADQRECEQDLPETTNLLITVVRRQQSVSVLTEDTELSALLIVVAWL